MRITEKTRFAVMLQYLTISENGYPDTDPRYAGERTKTAAGVEISRRIDAVWSIGARFKRAFISAEGYPDGSADADFDGGSASIWVTASF
jgi:hypothetical protein